MMKLKNGQKGFTLVEILAVMAICGILLTGIVVAIFQVFGTTRHNSIPITALENIKNSAYRISQDVRKASTTNLSDGAPAVSNLTLDWTIWYDTSGNLIPYGQYYRCKYSLPLPGVKLMRNYGTYTPSTTPTPPIPDSSFTWQPQTTISNYISSIQFSRQGSTPDYTITMTVTASPEGKTETAEQKTYYLYLKFKEAAVP